MLLHRKRILCVEDDEDVCSMITNLLNLIGYEVDSAATMAEAVSKIQDDKFDLYLIDNWLPGGSGIELCRRVRSSHSSVPIIFYSGAAYDDDKQQAMEAGANVYLVKPADIDKLIDAVKSLCENSSS
jgi:two-component system OmpR family response regulator